MTLKYSSHRPDENLDAIQNLEDAWTDPTREPEGVVVVARVSRYAIAKSKAGSEWQATAGIDHIELLDGADAEAAESLLTKAYGARTDGAAGQTPLAIPDVDEPALDLDTPLQDGKAV